MLRPLPALFPVLWIPGVPVLMLRPLPALFPVLRSPWSSSADAETSTALFPRSCLPRCHIAAEETHFSQITDTCTHISAAVFGEPVTKFACIKKKNSPVKYFLIASSAFALTCFNCSVSLKIYNSILYRIDIGMGLLKSPYDDEYPTNPFIT